jgi:hypothetical protein
MDPTRWAYFFALLFGALALAPAMAHLLTLPNKIALPQEAYFTVQGIYRGWALLGIVVFGALASSLALIVTVRRKPLALLWAVVAFLCVAGAQALFWTYTYPANVATSNWTEAPANWAALRDQWEYSHAAGAVLNLIAVAALVLSVLAPHRASKWSGAVADAEAAAGR